MKPPGNTFLTSLLRHTSPYRQENPHMTQNSHIYMESFIPKILGTLIISIITSILPFRGATAVKSLLSQLFKTGLILDMRHIVYELHDQQFTCHN